MRWLATLIVVTTCLASGRDRLSDTAMAEMGGSGIPLAPVAPVALASTPKVLAAMVRLDVPVSWQLTRSKLTGPDMSTRTETFRETWTMIVQPGGLLQLQSSRAVVPAYITGTPDHRVSAVTALPKAIMISEQSLARLVGVPTAGEVATESGEPPLDRPVTLELSKANRGGTDLSLTWSEDEHFAVHVEFGHSNML